MNICIIGLGWLGIPLAEKLKEDGHTINGSTKKKTKKKAIIKREINAFILDVSKSIFINQQQTSTIDVVVITIPPLKKENQNYYGDKLIEIVDQFPETSKFIFTSSTSVYENISGEYNEDSKKLIQSSPIFIAEKKLSGLLNSRLTILRLGGLVGLNRHPINILQGKKNIKNPKGLINLVHIIDVINAIKVIIKKSHFGYTYNLVNPYNPERKIYYDKMIEKYNLLPVSFESSSKIIHRKINASKICKELDFSFNTSIKKIE